MTYNDHQRERMRAWVRFYDGAEYADIVLAEFDKRFPAPSAMSEPGSVDELVQWTKRTPAAAEAVEAAIAAGALK